jgi:ABC-2 type transport system permease protein
VKLQRIKPIAVKEFRQVVRDTRTLSVLLFFPAFMMILFGYALSFDVKHVPLAVLDNDRSAQSRDYIQNFLHSDKFDLRFYLAGSNEVDAVLDDGRAQVVLVIPPDFADHLSRGEPAEVQINLDGSNSNSAATALGYVSAVTQDYSEQIRTRTLKRVGITNVPLPIDYRPRIWYNPELRSARFLVPGIIVQILLIMTVISTSLSVVREKERGTMEQIIVSPLHPIEVIVGKCIPYVLLSMVGAVMVLVMGWLLFGVAVKGSILMLSFAMLVFLVGGLGMGLLISTLTGTQRAAYQMSALMTMLPSILLSGFIFPLRNMPIPIQVVSYIIPARYFLPVLRGIIVKGTGLVTYWREMLFLVVFAVAVISLSTARLRRQMS